MEPRPIDLHAGQRWAGPHCEARITSIGLSTTGLIAVSYDARMAGGKWVSGYRVLEGAFRHLYPRYV